MTCMPAFWVTIGAPMSNGPPSSSRRLDSQADLAARAAVEKQLEEVEAALAVLQGQDPEQLRKLREARAQAEREFREIAERMEAQRARKARRLARRRRRLLIRTVVGIVVVLALVVFGRVGLSGRARWKSVNESLDQLSAPYLAYGLKAPPTKRATGNRIELTVPPGSCLIAIAATNTGEDARLSIERGLFSLLGERSVAWCSCAEESIVVTASAPSADALVGVKLLAAPGAMLGGSRALHLLEPLPKVIGPVAEECEPAHFDGWVRSGRAPKAPVDQSFFEAEIERTALVEAGLKVVARIPEEQPLGAVPPLRGSCFVAVGHEPAAAISLRAEGGARPLDAIREKPLVWCAKEAGPFTIWREGGGEVSILAGSSARVGGLIGLREIVRRAGVGEAVTWAGPTDLGSDAADALRASGAVDPVVTWPEPSSGPARAIQPRVVGLSVLAGGSFLPDPKSDATLACSPELVPGAVGQTVCIQSWPQAWRRVGAADLGGMAEAPLPFWLSSMQGVDHPTGLARAVELLALSRRLHARGFEPTVLEGVVELKTGIDVLGRAGEDAVVAVGVTPRAPWVIPYFEGQPWTLEGEPHVFELPPGEHLMLTSKAAAAIPLRDRRTIVFRRSVKNVEASAAQ